MNGVGAGIYEKGEDRYDAIECNILAAHND